VYHFSSIYTRIIIITFLITKKYSYIFTSS